MASISRANPSGSAATPTADWAGRPTRSPKARASRSVAPLATRCCSAKSGAVDEDHDFDEVSDAGKVSKVGLHGGQQVQHHCLRRLGSFGRRQVFAQATDVNGAVAVGGAVTGHEEQPAGRCRHDIGTDGWVLRRQQDAVALQGRLGCHRYTGIES